MSKYIYGLHELGGEHLFGEGRVSGWVVFTHELGHDPTHSGGADYRLYDCTPIARLNNGYEPNGTIPKPEFYQDFATRVGRWVNLSVGCSRWIIGNEPNHSVEWPDRHPISPEEYALCYMLCQEEIHKQWEKGYDEVVLAAIAPWFADTMGWLEYFTAVQDFIWRRGGTIDAFAIHAYTHGPDPSLITADTYMDAPFEQCQFNFKVYQDWIEAIYASYSKKPIYITETDQNEPWLNVNNGWVKEAYKEVDRWNRGDGRKIWCLCLYRWPDYDQYAIEGKEGVIEDFKDAIAEGYEREDMSETEWYEVAADGFEGDFPAYNGISELQAAEGWTPVWLEDPQGGVLDRPEFKPAGEAEVYTGEGAQAIHGAFCTIDGAIARRFPTIAGQQYYAEALCMGKTDTDATDQPMMGMVIDVDLSGGENYGGDYPKVESEWWSQDDPAWVNGGWLLLKTMPFTAQGNYITVYLRSANRFPARSHAHFDDFVLYGTEEGNNGGGGEGIAEELLTIAGAQLALSMKIKEIASRVGGGTNEAVTLIEEAEVKLQEAKAIL